MRDIHKELIGSFELHHPDDFPAITEDPYHLVDFLLKSIKIDSFFSALDIGTGTGVIPILLARDTGVKHITGVEIDADSAQCARENVERNGLLDKIEIINKDYRELPEGKFFDIVVSNPPYIKKGDGRKSGNDKKALARYEEIGNLKELIKASKRLLSSTGRLFLIFPTLRRAELMDELESVNMEPVRVEQLYKGKLKEIGKLFMIEVKRSKI